MSIIGANREYFDILQYLDRYYYALNAIREKLEIFDMLKIFGLNYLRNLHSGGIMYCAGNGGFAGLIDHFVGEMCGQFKMSDRNFSFPTISLCNSISTVTALSNDVGYSNLFFYQLNGFLKAYDSCLFISTSGTSENFVATFPLISRVNHIIIVGDNDEFNTNGYDLNVIILPIKYNKDTVPIIQDITSILLHYLAEKIEEMFIELYYNK